MKMPVMFLVYKRLTFRHMGQGANTSRLYANCRKQNRACRNADSSRLKRHGHTGETACPCHSFRMGTPFLRAGHFILSLWHELSEKTLTKILRNDQTTFFLSTFA